MVVTPPHILQGLTGTEQLNPGLVVGEKLAYLQCVDDSKINITQSTQCIQLYMKATGCRPGKQHMLLRTAHGVARPGSMECMICNCEGEEYRGDGLKPSDAELSFIGTLKGTKLDEQTIWQVSAYWWKDRKAQIDAYIYTRKLYLQVDGTKHTGTHRGKKVIDGIATDIGCCVDAWEAGAKLMRMHHDDVVDSACLLDALSCLKNQHGIVLSPSFYTVRWKKPNGTWLSYLECLKGRLPGCEMTERPCGNYVFTHQKQQSSKAVS